MGKREISTIPAQDHGAYVLSKPLTLRKNCGITCRMHHMAKFALLASGWAFLLTCATLAQEGEVSEVTAPVVETEEVADANTDGTTPQRPSTKAGQRYDTRYQPGVSVPKKERPEEPEKPEVVRQPPPPPPMPPVEPEPEEPLFPEFTPSSERPLEEWDLPVRLDDRFKIKKVYDFLNDPEKTQVGNNRAIEYEFQYFNHGAVTKAQRYNRQGQYYVVTWGYSGDPRDVTLRLDYRQGLTREKVTTLEIPYEAARGTYKGTFAVTGDRYYLNGQLISWRISLVHDGAIVAQEKSFVW